MLAMLLRPNSLSKQGYRRRISEQWLHQKKIQEQCNGLVSAMQHWFSLVHLSPAGFWVCYVPPCLLLSLEPAAPQMLMYRHFLFLTLSSILLLEEPYSLHLFLSLPTT